LAHTTPFPSGFTAELKEMEHNNIKQQVLILDGGDDEIEFDRVKFDHDLYIELKFDLNESNTSKKNIFEASSPFEIVLNGNKKFYYSFPSSKNIAYSFSYTQKDYYSYSGNTSFTTGTFNNHSLTFSEFYSASFTENTTNNNIENNSLTSTIFYIDYGNANAVSSGNDYTIETLSSKSRSIQSSSQRAIPYSASGQAVDNVWDYGYATVYFSGVRKRTYSGSSQAITDVIIPKNGNWSEYFLPVVDFRNRRVAASYFFQNRIIWERKENGKIVNINILNSFPFRIDKKTCFNTISSDSNYGEIVNLNNIASGVTATPYPSLNRITKNKENEDFITIPLTIQYKTFDSSAPKTLTINVRYKKRICYALWNGNTANEIPVNDITSFSQLKPKKVIPQYGTEYDDYNVYEK